MPVNDFIHHFQAPTTDMHAETLYESVKLTTGVEAEDKMIDGFDSWFMSNLIRQNTHMDALPQYNERVGQSERIVKFTDPLEPGTAMLYFEISYTVRQVEADRSISQQTYYQNRAMVYREKQTGRIVWAKLIEGADMGYTLEPNTIPMQVLNNYVPSIGERPKMIIKKHLGGYKDSAEHVGIALRKHYGMGKHQEQSPFYARLSQNAQQMPNEHHINSMLQSFKTEVNGVVDRMPALFIGPKNLKELVTAVVGESNVRSDITSAMGQANIGAIGAMACLWRDHMPVDWAVTFLRTMHAYDEKFFEMLESDEEVYKTWRRILLYQGEFRFQYGHHDLNRPNPKKEFLDANPELWDPLRMINGLQLGRSIIELAPVLKVLDDKSVRRLLQRKILAKDAMAIMDTATLVRCQIQSRFFTTLADAITGCDSWRDLEYKVNAHSARCRQLDEQERDQLKQSRVDTHALWLQTDAGAHWNQKIQEKVERQNQRNAADLARILERQATAAEAAATRAKARSNIQKMIRAAMDVANASNTVDGLLHVVATDQATLRTWGSTMGNCIAGYSADPEKTERLLVGSYNGPNLVATSEIALRVDTHTLQMMPELVQCEVRMGTDHEVNRKVHRNLYQLMDEIRQLTPEAVIGSKPDTAEKNQG